jgi:predicted peptidase
MRRFYLLLVLSTFMLTTGLQMGYCKDNGSITTSPQIQKYILNIPKKYKDTDQKLPLVVFIHGAGMVNDYSKLQSRVKLILNHQKDYPFIFFAPLLATRDNWEPIFLSLKSMLDEVVANYPVDTSRIYLTGISMGGNLGLQFAIENPNLFAAFASLAGGPNADNQWPESVLNNIGVLKNLPIRIYHGDKDTTVFMDRSETIVNALTEAGGNITLEVLPGRDHNIFDIYGKDDIFSWLFQNQKNQ